MKHFLANSESDSIPHLRIAIQQPALPAYRIPVFSNLNARDGIHAELFSGEEADLENAEPDGFVTHWTDVKSIKIPLIGSVLWDSNQWRLAGQSEWDVIVYSWNARYLSLMPSLIRAKFNRTPTILWGHGYSKNPSLLRNTIRNSLTKLAAAILFYDPISMQKSNNGIARENFFTAPNAIDQSKIIEAKKNWQSDPDRLAEFKEENNISDRPLVLFVSRIQEKNRIDVLIKAIAKVKEDRPNIFLAIAGGGSKTLISKFQNLIQELDIEQNVRLMGPVYGEDKLAPWFLSATAFCYPSNVGLSMMHAFGYGLPVIIGDDFSKCNPEIYAFKSQYNGLVFRADDPESLAQKILHLVNQPDLKATLGENAQQTIDETANIDLMVSGFYDAIQYATSVNRGN
ncbi:glycosyltransferase family 4 protein [bacterium]|nr:glycosyltransferase family 4 protein [bacterium]